MPKYHILLNISYIHVHVAMIVDYFTKNNSVNGCVYDMFRNWRFAVGSEEMVLPVGSGGHMLPIVLELFRAMPVLDLLNVPRLRDYMPPLDVLKYWTAPRKFSNSTPPSVVSRSDSGIVLKPRLIRPNMNMVRPPVFCEPQCGCNWGFWVPLTTLSGSAPAFHIFFSLRLCL